MSPIARSMTWVGLALLVLTGCTQANPAYLGPHDAGSDNAEARPDTGTGMMDGPADVVVDKGPQDLGTDGDLKDTGPDRMDGSKDLVVMPDGSADARDATLDGSQGGQSGQGGQGGQGGIAGTGGEAGGQGTAGAGGAGGNGGAGGQSAAGSPGGTNGGAGGSPLGGAFGGNGAGGNGALSDAGTGETPADHEQRDAQ